LSSFLFPWAVMLARLLSFCPHFHFIGKRYNNWHENGHSRGNFAERSAAGVGAFALRGAGWRAGFLRRAVAPRCGDALLGASASAKQIGPADQPECAWVT